MESITGNRLDPDYPLQRHLHIAHEQSLERILLFEDQFLVCACASLDGGSGVPPSAAETTFAF
jgi:hypothetical protein